MMDPLQMAVASLRELAQDSSLPRGVIEKLTGIIAILSQEGTQPSLRASQALQRIETLAEESSIQSDTRMQLFNVSSILETL